MHLGTWLTSRWTKRTIGMNELQNVVKYISLNFGRWSLGIRLYQRAIMCDPIVFYTCTCSGSKVVEADADGKLEFVDINKRETIRTTGSSHNTSARMSTQHWTITPFRLMWISPIAYRVACAGLDVPHCLGFTYTWPTPQLMLSLLALASWTQATMNYWKLLDQLIQPQHLIL